MQNKQDLRYCATVPFAIYSTQILTKLSQQYRRLNPNSLRSEE